MDMIERFAALAPRTIGQQFAALFLVALALLMAMVIALELAQQRTAEETLLESRTKSRLRSLESLVESVRPERLPEVIGFTSTCHSGFSVTENFFAPSNQDAETARLTPLLADKIDVDLDRLRIARAVLGAEDFSFAECPPGEINLPLDALVVSLRLTDGRWLNVEVHPHEWHIGEMLLWMLRIGGVFLVTGAITLLLLRRLNRPLTRLTAAAQRFASGLEPQPIDADGPDDVRAAIEAFNAMQLDVADAVRRRTMALAAISHDLRTPLTALRLRAEMVEDDLTRDALIASADRLDRSVASALDFLRSETADDPPQPLDLSALVESECEDCIAAGHPVEMRIEGGVKMTGRGELIARAVRNLIDNAVHYGGATEVELRTDGAEAVISVSDRGEGIQSSDQQRVFQPFERGSSARENSGGGLGLGLAIVEAAARAHDGTVELGQNQPSGLIVRLRMPIK